MHELTQMEGNEFTVKLLDIILPVKNKADLFSFNDLLIVMTLVERDVQSLFSKNIPTKFTQEHFICIMYNTLCCLNFLHTANIIHRDLKPNNLLITDQCGIVICDFGFSRTYPRAQDQSFGSNARINYVPKELNNTYNKKDAIATKQK